MMGEGGGGAIPKDFLVCEREPLLVLDHGIFQVFFLDS